MNKENPTESVEPMDEKVASQQASGSLSLQRFLVIFVGSAVLLLGLSWLLLDASLKEKVNHWISGDQISLTTYSLGAMTILTSDLILPVPSSAVITHAGSKLGFGVGTLIGTLGITAGSLIGYGLVCYLGNGFVAKRISKTDRQILESWTHRYGVFVIVLLRPVPLFAEASVLLLAVGKMKFRTFLIWLTLSNFFVSLFFAAFGQWAQSNGIGEFPSLLISISIPILLLLLTQYCFKKNSLNPNDDIAQEKT